MLLKKWASHILFDQQFDSRSCSSFVSCHSYSFVGCHSCSFVGCHSCFWKAGPSWLGKVGCHILRCISWSSREVQWELSLQLVNDII